MTKTLRTASIITAVVAVVLVAAPAVFSSGVDEQAKKILDLPGVLESITNNAGSLQSGAESPLVLEAKKFALYLDPPPPPKPVAPPPSKRTNRAEQRVTAKFELLGTSYYPERPHLSLALIDEPGTGLRWLRQSSKIGQLTIEEVQDGKIVINDGQGTYELEPKRVAKRSLVKGEFSSATTSSASASQFNTAVAGTSRTSNVSSRAARQSRSLPGRTDSRISERISRPEPAFEQSPGMLDAQSELLKKYAEQLENIDDPNEWVNKADELMEQLKNVSQVSGEEAQNLGALGEELNDSNQAEQPDAQNEEN